MAVKLKPCPFCGSDNVIIFNTFDSAIKRYNVECLNCMATIPAYSQKKDVVKHWNRRAEVKDD